MTWNRIDQGVSLAAEQHAGQVRYRPAGLPYVTHCEEVAALVEEHGGDEAAIIAAWLHDAVEDTPTTLAEIEGRFGGEVASIVAEVTDDPSLSKDEARRADRQRPGEVAEGRAGEGGGPGLEHAFDR